jgi:hypothetical protein
LNISVGRGEIAQAVMERNRDRVAVKSAQAVEAGSPSGHAEAAPAAEMLDCKT